MKLQELNKQYESICNEYVKKFSKKQGIKFTGWVGNLTGEIAVFIDQYFFNLENIIFDLNTKQPKGLIIEWMDECVAHESSVMLINYKSYTMGLRFEDLK